MLWAHCWYVKCHPNINDHIDWIIDFYLRRQSLISETLLGRELREYQGYQDIPKMQWASTRSVVPCRHGVQARGDSNGVEREDKAYPGAMAPWQCMRYPTNDIQWPRSAMYCRSEYKVTLGWEHTLTLPDIQTERSSCCRIAYAFRCGARSVRCRPARIKRETESVTAGACTMYPYCSLEGHGLGGWKLKTQQNTHAATQWFKKTVLQISTSCISKKANDQECGRCTSFQFSLPNDWNLDPFW